MSFEFKSDTSYELWALAHTDPPRSKTSRFMTMSVLFHAGLLAAAVWVVPLVDEAKRETITIEIAEPVRTISRGAPVPVMNEGAASAKADRDEVAAPARPTVKAKPIAAKSHATKAAVSHSAPRATVAAAPEVATIDDIEAPEIDQALNESEPAASLDENFAEQAFSQIDEEQDQRVLDEKNKLVQDAQTVAAENEEQLEDLRDDNREEAAALAQANRERRARDAQAIAAAAEGERQAQQKAAALAAARKNGSGHKGTGGNAQGSSHTTTAAGSPNGVRSLDQLRQMPGNRGPMYSREERRARQEGLVSFMAYVTKEGHLTKFRQMSSTGHRSLDSKTLQALQKWRFYPGQEGWVELPFRWDLRGQPQALDGLLRVQRKDISRL